MLTGKTISFMSSYVKMTYFSICGDDQPGFSFGEKNYSYDSA